MVLQMKENMYAGLLITFCGLDGSGKTTQINLLKTYMEEQGMSVYLTKQPTQAVRKSDIFRTYIDTPERGKFDCRALSLMCAADRLQHTSKEIVPRLSVGQTVISDRYYYSCLANHRACGYTEDKWIYEIAEYIVRPDIAFFLDTDAETAVSRVRSREAERERYIDMDLQYKLREQYIQLAAENGGIIIGAGMSVGEVSEAVRTVVNQKIAERRHMFSGSFVYL